MLIIKVSWLDDMVDCVKDVIIKTFNRAPKIVYKRMCPKDSVVVIDAKYFMRDA